MPTSPTPADRPADGRTTWPTAEPLQQAADLRRAAGDPLLADWLDATANALAWLAPYRDHEPGYGMWEAALAVARQLLGTTEGAGRRSPTTAPTVAATLATPCDACDHTLNWHRNDVGCTVPRCVCGRFQDPVEAAAPPAPADRAAVLNETADRLQRRATQLNAVWLRADQVIDAIRRIADEKAEEDRLAADAAAGVQPPTSEADTVRDRIEDALVRMDAMVWLGCRRGDRDHDEPIGVTTLAARLAEAVTTPPAAPAAPEEPQ